MLGRTHLGMLRGLPAHRQYDREGHRERSFRRQVRGWSETHVHIADLESDEELSVALDHMRYLRIGFAITMAAVQGRTLRAHTRIWDCDHRNFTTRHLAMAIGRVTRPEDLDFA